MACCSRSRGSRVDASGAAKPRGRDRDLAGVLLVPERVWWRSPSTVKPTPRATMGKGSTFSTPLAFSASQMQLGVSGVVREARARRGERASTCRQLCGTNVTGMTTVAPPPSGGGNTAVAPCFSTQVRTDGGRAPPPLVEVDWT